MSPSQTASGLRTGSPTSSHSQTNPTPDLRTTLHTEMTDDRCRFHLSQLSELLGKLKTKSLFLVADATAFEHSGARQCVTPQLEGLHVTTFTEFEPNPKYDDVLVGLDAFRSSGADTMLAIGGGTAIDVAKLIGTFAVSAGSPRSIILKSQPLSGTPCPLIAVPTTSGTGSEATQFAVVYLDGVKYSVDDPRLLPTYCILDGSLTAQLPPQITAHSGLDAFAQAIESMWSVRSTESSFRNAYEAASLALTHLKAAVDSSCPTAREAMIKAAHLAGRAINQTRTTAPHAISYSITSGYGVPHGQAVALTLGPMLEYNAGVTEADANDPRGSAHTRDRIQKILELLNCETPAEGKRRIQEFIESLGCQSRLSSFGIQTPEQLRDIATQVNVDRLNNNPRKISEEQLIRLLESIG